MTSTFWMDRALALARRAQGATAPNPAVGAVLTRDGRLLGEGWHRGPGQPHAEAEALADAQRRGHDPRGATLWVTLEPCCHGPTKRTPPCAPRLIQAGIAEVRAAVPDPNPLVSGRGRELLMASGVRFSWGPRQAEAAELIADFRAWVTQKRPFVTLKWAQTLGGQLRSDPNQDRWLTGLEARTAAHQLRADHDAVVMGAGTLREDDPALTVRHVPVTRQPRRLLFAGSQPLPPQSQIFTDEHADQTWIVTTPGTDVLQVQRLCPGRVLPWDGQDWDALGAQLLSAGFYRLLVEGGPRLLSTFLEVGWWDKTTVFTAPHWQGLHCQMGIETSGKLVLASPHWSSVGGDSVLSGWNPEALCSRA